MPDPSKDFFTLSRKTCFLKKPNPLAFWVLLGFGLYWVFADFVI